MSNGAEFKSWHQFVKGASDELLDVVPTLESIDKGVMNFSFELNGKKYHAAGSHDYISGYHYNPQGTLCEESNFDNFHLVQIGDSFEWLEEICNW